MGLIIFTIVVILIVVAVSIIAYKSDKNGVMASVIVAGLVLTLIVYPAVLIKNVEITEVGIIINAATQTTRTAALGYNFLGIFEKLEKFDATVCQFTFQTEKEKNIHLGAQTNSGSYAEVIISLSVRVNREEAQSFAEKFGPQAIDKNPDISDYILIKLNDALKEVFARYNIENLVASDGPVAAAEVKEILRKSLKDDDIILEAFTVSDTEGNATFEAAISEKQRLIQENASLLQQKINAQVQAEKDLIEAQAETPHC